MASPEVEKTLALIKPDAVRAGKAEEIKQLIELHGFTIVAQQKLQVWWMSECTQTFLVYCLRMLLAVPACMFCSLSKGFVCEHWLCVLTVCLQLTRARAEEFYGEHYGKPFFPTLVNFMTSGPIWALVLAKPDAIKGWRELMGPTNVFKAREEKPRRWVMGIMGSMQHDRRALSCVGSMHTPHPHPACNDVLS